MDDPNIVTITDVRKAGYCVSGARNWFRAREIDFHGFIRTGMPVTEFLERGDAYAIDVIDKKREREKNG